MSQNYSLQASSPTIWTSSPNTPFLKMSSRISTRQYINSTCIKRASFKTLFPSRKQSKIQSKRIYKKKRKLKKTRIRPPAHIAFAKKAFLTFPSRPKLRNRKRFSAAFAWTTFTISAWSSQTQIGSNSCAQNASSWG